MSQNPSSIAVFTFTNRAAQELNNRLDDTLDQTTENSALTNERYLLNLDEDQLAAVTAGIGPTLVNAAPGSGKTRVIIARVAWLIDQHHADHQVASSTFHAFGSRFLREFASYTDRVAPNFSIYDRNESLAILTEVASRFPQAAELKLTPSKCLAIISGYKHQQVSPEVAIQALQFTPADPYAITAAQIYDRYETALIHQNALDFEDLLKLTLETLNDKPDIRREMNGRYRHILVDEYQDTNEIQHQISVRLATAESDASIFVVGDADQSIYAFRHADIQNLLQFNQTYPNASFYNLSNNYRSTPQIVGAAQSIISSNTQRIPNQVHAVRASGDSINYYLTNDPTLEAITAGLIMKSAILQGASPSQCCIAYRINAQSRVIEEALQALNIPYQVNGAYEFFHRMEVRLNVAYLRLAHNPLDDAALSRVHNTPRRGIGDQSWSRLSDFAYQQDLPMTALLGLLAETDPSVQPLHDQINARTLAGITTLSNQLQELHRISRHATPHDLLLQIEDQFQLRRYINDYTTNAEQRIKHVDELFKIAEGYAADTLPDFLHRVANSESATEEPDFPEDPEQMTERVMLSTLHQTKGLEFDHVCIVGCENGLIPHARARSRSDIEEERRLLYVGMTRARLSLHMLSARRRAQGQKDSARSHSRFLDAIPTAMWSASQRRRHAA